MNKSCPPPLTIPLPSVFIRTLILYTYIRTVCHCTCVGDVLCSDRGSFRRRRQDCAEKWTHHDTVSDIGHHTDAQQDKHTDQKGLDVHGGLPVVNIRK
jgi:hypothetical protein